MNNLWVWFLQQILPRRYWYRRFYGMSKHWRELAKRKKQTQHYRCGNCGKYNAFIDVHHKWYYRNGKSILWKEKLYDLQVLCRKCHKLEHAD